MDRRRLALAVSSGVALLTRGELAPTVALAQTVRSKSPAYIGAMTVMWRTVRSARQEVSRLLTTQNRSSEEWRIDVLSPFAVVAAVREAARAIVPPPKYAGTHALWLEALDDLASAGVYLRNGILADNERSVQLGRESLDRATELLAEIELSLPRRVYRTIE